MKYYLKKIGFFLITLLIFSSNTANADLICKRDNINYSRWKTRAIAEKLNPEFLVIQRTENTARLNHFTKGMIDQSAPEGHAKLTFDYPTLDASNTKMTFQHYNNGSAIISWTFGQISAEDSTGLSTYTCDDKFIAELASSLGSGDDSLCASFFFVGAQNKPQSAHAEIITNLQDKTRAQWGENWQAEKYDHCRSLLIGKPLSVITYTKPH